MTSNSSMWIHLCAVVALVLLLICSLSGAMAQPRTILGWQLEHFLGYFAVTLIVRAAWPRPLAVAVAMVVVAGLMEVLQFFTPNRHPNLEAVIWGAGGVVVAVVLAELFIRARKASSEIRKIR